MDKARLAELKAKHGEIYTCSRGGEEIVLRGPSPQEWDRFHDTVDDQKSLALEVLVRACVVHPEGEAFTALRNRKPGICQSLIRQIRTIAGADEQEEAKKV